eukprot:IDg6842t1
MPVRWYMIVRILQPSVMLDCKILIPSVDSTLQNGRSASENVLSVSNSKTSVTGTAIQNTFSKMHFSDPTIREDGALATVSQDGQR